MKKYILLLLSVIFFSCSIQDRCVRDIQRAKLNCPELFQVTKDTFYKVKIDTFESINIDTFLVSVPLNPIELEKIIGENDSLLKIIFYHTWEKKDSAKIFQLHSVIQAQKKNIYLLKEKLKTSCNERKITIFRDRIITKDSIITIDSKTNAVIKEGFNWDIFLFGLLTGFLLFIVIRFLYIANKK